MASDTGVTGYDLILSSIRSGGGQVMAGRYWCHRVRLDPVEYKVRWGQVRAGRYWRHRLRLDPVKYNVRWGPSHGRSILVSQGMT